MAATGVNKMAAMVFFFRCSAMGFLYPPEASGGYFGLASATPPPPRVERFSALTL